MEIWHVRPFFFTISSFLVIDDNTTKASKINARNDTKCKHRRVRINLACLDGIFNAQLHLPPAYDPIEASGFIST